MVRRLTRSNDRILGGVVSGLADYLKIDTSILRLIFVLLLIFTAVFPMVIFYIVAWLIIPEK